jgi:hypothetical protein
MKYKIYDDRKMTGSKELNDEKFIKKYIDKNIHHKDLTYLYMTIRIDDEYEIYTSRFISFESSLHKDIWVANNYKKSLGVLDTPAQMILN